MNRRSTRVYPGIFFLSAATLTYEIGLTRIFSISQGYHFAFMVISIALLGIGAGGAVMIIADRRVRIAELKNSALAGFLSTLSAIFAVVSVLSFIAANQIMFDPVKAAWSRFEFLKILAQYLILSLPFMITGMALSAAYRHLSDKVHSLYLADMAGAGTGCVLVLYILSMSGGEAAVTVSAVLSLIASLFFFFSASVKGKSLFLPIFAKVLLLLAVLSSNQIMEIRISPYRELSSVLNFPGGRIVKTMFSPSGRLDIVESPAARAAPGISLTYQKPLPGQMGFTINGGGLSTVTDAKGDLSFLRHLPSSLPYRLAKGGDVFIIDPGGGMEILSALENRAGDISGSESRGIVISAMKGPLSDFSSGLYNRIDIKHGYGRAVLKESERYFDVIQLPMTDTLGSSSTGFMGLQEEYNLTVEAFSDYMKHLKKDGFLSASLYLLPPPRQELKLPATIAETLSSPEHMGNLGRPLMENVADRIIAIRSWGVLTILAKNGFITGSDIETVKEFCRTERFDLVWYPGMKENEANIYNKFPEPLYYRFFKTLLEGDRERFYKDYVFDIRPATDDRPFFGQTFKMGRMKETYESVGKKLGILIEGGYLLPWILVQSFVAGVVLIMFPLFRWKREKGGSLLSITVFFSSIGIGYMFLEISLMQRMIPVLGEPVYAISAILFTLLVSTGVGSYLSGRYSLTERHSIHIIIIIPVIAVIYLVLIGNAAEKIAAVNIALRFILTFLLLFPLGIVMGMPFPTGMSMLGKKMPGLIPWAWCINGSFSVIGSVLAMLAALTWGFNAVHFLAVLSYAAAWFAIISLKSSLP